MESLPDQGVSDVFRSESVGRVLVSSGRCQVWLRDATAEDAERIERFGREVLLAHYTPILGEETAQAELSWWQSDRMATAARAGSVFLAVDDADVIEGLCETGEFEGEWVVWKLYVHHSVRGRGIGKCLLDVAVKRRPAGTTSVVLEHFAGNEKAGRFYQREGFQVFRLDAARSGDPNAATVWRRRNLRA